MLFRELISIGEDDNVLLEVLNARSIRIKFSKIVFITKNKHNRIESIRCDNSVISLFDDITVSIDATKKSIYKIKIIEQLNEKAFLFITHSQTKTTLFLLPLLYRNTFLKDCFLYDTFFISAYLSESHKELKLLYRFSESYLFESFEKRIKEHPLFIHNEDYDYETVLYTFKIPDEDLGIVSLFIAGKYSQFPDYYKKAILSFFRYSEDGELANILYKSDKRRKQLELKLDTSISKNSELFSIPELTEEII